MSQEALGWKEEALTVAAVARSNLQRKKDEAKAHRADRKRSILAAFEARMHGDANLHSQVPMDDTNVQELLRHSDKAAFVWLDELGPAFRMPLEGHVAPSYTSVNDFTVAILDHANSALVTKTLADSQHKFVGEADGILPLPVVEGMVSYFQAQHRMDRMGLKEMKRKVRLWQLLAGTSDNRPAPSSQRVVGMLGTWQSAWACHDDLARWNAERFQRREICKQVADAADILKMLTDAFSWSSENQEEWLDLEAERLMSLPLNLPDAGSRRKREVVGVARYEEEKSKWAAEMEALVTEKERIEAERLKLEKEVVSLKHWVAIGKDVIDSLRSRQSK